MKQVLIQLDDRTAAELEKAAPGRSRKRSEFVRRAIARALQDLLEERTRAAYEKDPDEAGGFDPAEWAAADEALHPSAATARRATPKRSRR
jgi:hypothetical protein